MGKKKPPGYKAKGGERPNTVHSRARYVVALDDSGPPDPLLNKRGKFAPSWFSSNIIGGVGINRIYFDDFNHRWQELRQEIRESLGCEQLPAMHARLMFGDNRPSTYRGLPNPYLSATREQVAGWYLAAVGIIGSYLKLEGGGFSFSNTQVRSLLADWEQVFQQPEALAESEFLKLYKRRKHPELHRRYLATITSAQTMPTLDAFMLVEEGMRQNQCTATLLLDSYSDAVAFDEGAAFRFIAEHLGFTRIVDCRYVNDSDEEPLVQAADLIAYSQFRYVLHHDRLRTEPSRQLEEFIVKAEQLISGRQFFHPKTERKLAALRGKDHHRKIYSAARYAVALHILSSLKDEGETVREVFKTLEEFQAVCETHVPFTRYLPILKDGVLERWEASGRSDSFNGEDHP